MSTIALKCHILNLFRHISSNLRSIYNLNVNILLKAIEEDEIK